MKKFDIKELQKHFRCSEPLHNTMLTELVYLVASHPSNLTADSVVDSEKLRQVLYGDEFGTPVEKVMGISGYWGNDLALVFADAVGFEGNVFSELFSLLGGVEIMTGVVVKKS